MHSYGLVLQPLALSISRVPTVVALTGLVTTKTENKADGTRWKVICHEGH